MVQTRAFTEGFDLYPLNNPEGFGHGSTWQLALNSASANIVSPGRFGGQCLQMTAYSSQAMRLFPATTEIAYGFAFKRNNGAEPGGLITALQSPDGNTQISIGMSSLGRLNVGYQTNGGIFIQSDLTEVQNNVWYYFEIELKMADVGGILRIYKDGVLLPEFDWEGDTKGHSDPTLGRLLLNSAANSYYFDDIYLEVDGYQRVGEGRMEVLPAVADVSQTGFTPSQGTKIYPVVGNVPADIFSSARATDAGSIFRVKTKALSTVPEQIYGVEIVNVSQKNEAGTRTLRNKLWSSASLFNGATTAANLDSPTFKRDWLALDPDGDVEWDAAAVNALEIGAEIIT